MMIVTGPWFEWTGELCGVDNCNRSLQLVDKAYRLKMSRVRSRRLLFSDVTPHFSL